MRRAAITALLLAASTACSVGQGQGDVAGMLFAHDCWGELNDGGASALHEPYDLQPDFFAANPSPPSLTIEVQRGSDLAEFSDGLVMLVDDVCSVRTALGETCDTPGAPATNVGGPVAVGSGSVGSRVQCPFQDDAGVPAATFTVDVPAGVELPGSPTGVSAGAAASPAIVHMSLYLESTCHNENVVLNSVSGTATFRALFDADPNEANAKDKLTDATFDVWFADLSDVPLGGTPNQVPLGLQSHIQGCFKFYFERGQPGQPFP